MKSKTILILLALLAIVVGALIWRAALAPQESPTPSTGTPDNSLATYTNSEYGFELSYPKALAPDTEFKLYYHLANTWRAGGTEDTGRLLLAIPVYRVENETSYPRYFAVEVRVGVSTATKDIADCYTNDMYFQATTTPLTMINGVAFKTFPLETAGMMQYLKGVSYRSIHNSACFALEVVNPGSSYRDDPVGTSTISDAVLATHYADALPIAQTFKFTK